MTPEAFRKREQRDAAYRAARIAASQPRPNVLAAAIPEPPSVALPRAKPRSGNVAIVCKDCGERRSVRRRDAAAAIDFHRAICQSRLRGIEKPASKAAYRRMSAARIERPKKAFCPTCRDEMYRSHDAWTCPAGCTNLA